MARRKAKCYGCDRRTRTGFMFCSQSCAASYAENLLDNVDTSYCPRCGTWETVRFHSDQLLTCGHTGTGKTGAECTRYAYSVPKEHGIAIRIDAISGLAAPPFPPVRR